MRRVSRSLSWMMIVEKFLPLAGVEAGIVVQDLGERADRRQRRAQLVRHGGDEIVLQPVELLQPLVGGAKLGGRRHELARLLLQLVAVGDHLRRLVQHRADLVERERFFLDGRRDHDSRRSSADRAGERGLRELDESGVRRQLRRPTSAPRRRA